ncbi:MAG: DUF4127 family protein [Cyanobacteria bacterium SIG30]|nr:DUF4127 family protein [Cyanobacteria bacterium SIG30]
MKKIAFIPIDDRPICYTLIQQITAIDKDIDLYMPKREYLGNLTKSSNIEEILSWLNNLDKIDYLILSLDTIAYGGLINSRRSNDTYDEIISRIKKLEKIIENKKCKTYAFSSIMRISNNNINEEEKEYWNIWGKKIFEYSYHTHKARANKTETCIENRIPKDILDDYLNTRNRNFLVNQYYLEIINKFDYLIFSKDDTGKFGLNVEEAEILNKKIKEKKLNAKVKTGADEIPLSLLSRAIMGNSNLTINPIFIKNESINLISKYEDISIKECVMEQIEITGAKTDDQNYDIKFFINNFEAEQGDHVLGDLINKNNIIIEKCNTPYFIADVNNANGADDNLIDALFKNSIDDNFYGYAGYNTSANTIGCALCIAITRYLAKRFDENAFKKLLFTRFMDDWAYQAHIRKTEFNKFELYENKINRFLKTKYTNLKYNRPWNRSFEIEITIE